MCWHGKLDTCPETFFPQLDSRTISLRKKWPRECSTCRKHFPVLFHSWLITGFVTRATWQMPLVEQEWLNLPEHLTSPPVFSGVCVPQSLVFCVVFCRSLFVLFLLTIVFSVLRFTDSDYPLVSFGHWVVCPLIYRFWLPLWYLLTIVLSVLRFTDYDYPFGIFWPLCCLSFDLQNMITPLVSFDHCVVCPSIYRLWLSLWYLSTIVFSVLRFTDSDYLPLVS